MTSLVFIDPKTARGGGQVVLEGLLARISPRVDTHLVMPEAGYRSITVPSDVAHHTRLKDLSTLSGRLTLVANANAAFPSLVLAAWALRRHGIETTTVGIVHNYAGSMVKRVATHGSLARLDHAVVVEPGLTALRRDALIPTWLSIDHGDVDPAIQPSMRTGRLRAFARPDRTKGLHLLPQIFRSASQQGWTCEVALGDPLDGDSRYERTLRTHLAPWLVAGRRTAEWLEPGDVLIVPSIAGEAACLTAQEALARGAFVVASQLGLMPHLLPEDGAIRTFPVGDATAAIARLTDIAALSEEQFRAACGRSQTLIQARAGRWYDEVADWLLGLT